MSCWAYPDLDFIRWPIFLLASKVNIILVLNLILRSDFGSYLHMYLCLYMVDPNSRGYCKKKEWKTP